MGEAATDGVALVALNTTFALLELDRCCWNVPVNDRMAVAVKVETFLADGGGRLVLDVSYDDAPRQAGYAAVWRPHSHHYTILAVAAARRDGVLRVAATGVAPRAVLLDPDDPLKGLELRDDVLASAWYRTQLLPRLVTRALAQIEEVG